MRRLKQNKHIVNMLFIIHSIRLNSITAGMNNCKSIIKKKKKKKPSKIVLFGKTRLDITKVLISKALINLYISYDEFVSVNNVLREYIEIKEEIKYCETSV